MVCLLTAPCFAAPTTDAPGTVDSTNSANTGLAATPLLGPNSARTGAGAGNSDTRTIDLLVEMQQPTAGVQFNERAGRDVSREASARKLQASPGVVSPGQIPAQRPQDEMPQTPPSGLFGSGATPAVQGRSSNVVDRPPSNDGVPARASGRSSPDVSPELKRWLLWPRELVDYVRENRAFVAGCAAALLLMGWTGSLMFGRRRG